jgi:hypothetical protein
VWLKLAEILWGKGTGMSEQEIHVNSGNVDTSKVRVLVETDQDIDQSGLDHVEREVNRWLAGGRTSLVSVNCKVRVFGLPESRYVYERTTGAVTERFEAPSLSELQSLITTREKSTTPVYTFTIDSSPIIASIKEIEQEMQKYQEGLQRFLMWPGCKKEATTDRREEPTDAPTTPSIPPFRIDENPQKYIHQMAVAQREIHKALDEREPTMRSAKWRTLQPKQLKPADRIVVSEMKNSKGESFDPQPVVELPVADAIRRDRDTGRSYDVFKDGSAFQECTTTDYAAHHLRVFRLQPPPNGVWDTETVKQVQATRGIPCKGSLHPDKPGKRCVSLEYDRLPDIVDEVSGMQLWLVTAHYR